MNQPLVQFRGIAAPLLRDNIDTDAIIPSREMKSTGKTGLAGGLFAGWRYLSTGNRQPDPAFVLNDPRFAGASILLAGANFGCGSSREHAVWALAEYGIKAVVAPSFAPIFRANCIRNGLLPAMLDAAAIEQIAAWTGDGPAERPVAIDVPGRGLTLGDGRCFTFPLDDQDQAMLVEGLDPIDLTLKHRGAIDQYLARDRQARPWVYLDPTS